MSDNYNRNLTQDDFYIVSVQKFIILSLITMGAYSGYWWYRNFYKLIKRVPTGNSATVPIWIVATISTILTPLFGYVLLDDIAIISKNNGVSVLIRSEAAAGIIAIGSIATFIVQLQIQGYFYFAEWFSVSCWVLSFVSSLTLLVYVNCLEVLSAKSTQTMVPQHKGA